MSCQVPLFWNLTVQRDVARFFSCFRVVVVRQIRSSEGGFKNVRFSVLVRCAFVCACVSCFTTRSANFKVMVLRLTFRDCKWFVGRQNVRGFQPNNVRSHANRFIQGLITQGGTCVVTDSSLPNFYRTRYRYFTFRSINHYLIAFTSAGASFVRFASATPDHVRNVKGAIFVMYNSSGCQLQVNGEFYSWVLSRAVCFLIRYLVSSLMTPFVDLPFYRFELK